MGFLQHDKNGAGLSYARSARLSAERHLKEEIEYHPDGDIGRTRRNAAEIKDRDGLLLAEPFLHDGEERIDPMRIASRFLEETQLRIEKAKAEKIGACSISAVRGSLVWWLTARPVRFKLCWTQEGSIARIHPTGGVWIAFACAGLAIL